MRFWGTNLVPQIVICLELWQFYDTIDILRSLCDDARDPSLGHFDELGDGDEVG